MKSNYKRLGDYIKPVKEKNIDLKASKLLGINIDKFFMPSVANVIGTDMTNYKIVKKGQFACNRMHVGRDYRIPIALAKEENPFMVSPAYDVFEITATNILLPEYLMMWFSRKEFDRNTWFHTDADVRGGLPWSAFCDLELPIPSIEKQREIVREYNTIQNRIALNNQLITKLEETAQAIYKQWFVDFEFPDENGEPYKSNGGVMVWCEELEKEIPEGWEIVNLEIFGKVVTGKTPSSEFPDEFGNDMKFVTPGDFKYFTKYAYKTDRHLSKKGIAKLKSKILPKGSVIVTCIGSDMGKIVLTIEDCITNQQMNSIDVLESFYSDYLYEYLNNISSEIKSIAMGSSTMPMLNKTEFEKILIIKPINNLLVKFEKLLNPSNALLLKSTKESQKLEELKVLLLSKLTIVE